MRSSPSSHNHPLTARPVASPPRPHVTLNSNILSLQRSAFPSIFLKDKDLNTIYNCGELVFVGKIRLFHFYVSHQVLNKLVTFVYLYLYVNITLYHILISYMALKQVQEVCEIVASRCQCLLMLDTRQEHLSHSVRNDNRKGCCGQAPAQGSAHSW